MAAYAYALPELGEGIESGDVVQVLVAVGDSIEKDQPVLELETDKAVIEVPSLVSGVVQMIHVREGDKAAVGQLLLTVETAALGTTPAPTAPAAPAEVPSITPAPATPTEAAAAAPVPARFVQWLVETLQEPFLLALEG
jgi:pyruvate/2-oxoglutarate dehydrogenase complex dihydrolipoamide acyltransferase (E2) component